MAYRLEPTATVAGLRRALAMGGSFCHDGVQLGVPVGVGVGVGVRPPPDVPTIRNIWSGQVMPMQVVRRPQSVQGVPYPPPGLRQAVEKVLLVTLRPSQNQLVPDMVPT